MTSEATGINTREEVIPVNGIIKDIPCGCCLEVTGDGKMWIRHEVNCLAMQLREVSAKLRQLHAVMLVHRGVGADIQPPLEMLQAILEEHRRFQCALSPRQRANLNLPPNWFIACSRPLPRPWHDFLPDEEIVEMLATMDDADLGQFLEARKKLRKAQP